MKKILFIIFVFYANVFFAQTPEILTNKNVEIKRLDVLNSKYREVNLSITPDGKYLFFMTTRGGQPWSVYSGTFKGIDRYDGDIWYSKNVNGQWQKPHPLDTTINTYNPEDEPCVMPDGQRVVFQQGDDWWETTGGPYYMAEMNGQKWSNPVGLGGGINRYFRRKMDKYGMYATDGMCLSPDGKTFVVACGVDYEGNLNLYISHLRSDGWSYLMPLGGNTPGDERSVFIAADNKTIYFASDGYGGFGGLDIFKGELTRDNRIINIKNIGAPFNTSHDDYGFIITADGKKAYFIRDDDIYEATLSDDNQVAPGESLLISGNVKNCAGKPLQTYLYLTDAKGRNITNTKSSYDGKYLFSVEFKSGTYQITDTKGNVLKKIKITKNSENTLNINLQVCNHDNSKAKGTAIPH